MTSSGVERRAGPRRSPGGRPPRNGRGPARRRARASAQKASWARATSSAARCAIPTPGSWWRSTPVADLLGDGECLLRVGPGPRRVTGAASASDRCQSAWVSPSGWDSSRASSSEDVAAARPSAGRPRKTRAWPGSSRASARGTGPHSPRRRRRRGRRAARRCGCRRKERRHRLERRGSVRCRRHRPARVERPGLLGPRAGPVVVARLTSRMEATSRATARAAGRRPPPPGRAR